MFEWSSLCVSLTECQPDKLDTSKESNASFPAYNTRVSLACVSRLKMCFTSFYVVFSQVAQLHTYYVPMCLHNHPLFRVTRAHCYREGFGAALLCGNCSFTREDVHINYE